MRDTVPTPVPGDPASKGAPDGVSGKPDAADRGEVHGRSAEGESGGGAYPNPHTGHGDPKSEFFGSRGQTPLPYHGGGQAGEDGRNAPNAVAGSDGDTETAPAPIPAPDRAERVTASDNGAFTVVEESGVAEAETRGKIAIKP